MEKIKETTEQKVNGINRDMKEILSKVKDSITPENIVGLVSVVSGVIGGVVVLVLNGVMEHGYTITATKGDTTVVFAPGTNQMPPAETIVDATDFCDEENASA